MDEKLRIQDDLYNYVNQEWLEKAVIPADKPTTGGFADLQTGVESTLIKDLNELCESGKYPNDYIARTCALYKAVKDVEAREKAGIKPALDFLARIQKLTDLPDFNKNLGEFTKGGFPLPFRLSVDEDMKDTNKYCVMLSGPSTLLPDVTYYKDEMKPQHDAILGLWSNMAAQVLAHTDLSADDQKAYLESTVKFDAVVATLVKSAEEWSEYTKCYNPMPVDEVAKLLAPVDVKGLLSDLFGYVPEVVVVAEPRFLEGFAKLFNAETFEDYKCWAYVTELISDCSVLTEELRAISSSYRMALTGVAEVTPVEKFAYQLAGSIYSEPLGLYYGEKYFGEEAKKDIVDMVYQIIETYKDRVRRNDFLEEATKEKAILKLSTMKVKMGYPDKVDPFYDELVFDESESLINIMADLTRARIAHKFSLLSKPVDKSKWPMPGHMVNACYNPTANDITFPAAILQAPFYSFKQSRSQNLGGIGAVIGHEISHAFDNNGAKCDENGNLNNWWTEEDNAKFLARTQAMVEEFDGIELPWGKVNGAFIVSENIADNGGMAVTLEIMSKLDGANYEEYFVNWAKVWCMKAKPEYLQLLLKVDVHAPTILRANMQPRNFEEWYKTFDVKETDKMYLEPSKRVNIW